MLLVLLVKKRSQLGAQVLRPKDQRVGGERVNVAREASKKKKQSVQFFPAQFSSTPRGCLGQGGKVFAFRVPVDLKFEADYVVLRYCLRRHAWSSGSGCLSCIHLKLYNLHLIYKNSFILCPLLFHFRSGLGSVYCLPV